MMLDEHDELDKCVIAGIQLIMNTLRDYGVMYTDLLLCQCVGYTYALVIIGCDT